MTNNNSYYRLLADVRYFKTKTIKNAIAEILIFITNSFLKIKYVNGAIYIAKDIDAPLVINSSSIIYKPLSTVKISRVDKYSDILERQDLALKLLSYAIAALPTKKDDEHILAVFYYNMLNKMSYKDMFNKKLYKLSRGSFMRDKKLIENILKRVFLLENP